MTVEAAAKQWQTHRAAAAAANRPVEQTEAVAIPPRITKKVPVEKTEEAAHLLRLSSTEHCNAKHNMPIRFARRVTLSKVRELKNPERL